MGMEGEWKKELERSDLSPAVKVHKICSDFKDIGNLRQWLRGDTGTDTAHTTTPLRGPDMSHFVHQSRRPERRTAVTSYSRPCHYAV